MLFAIIQLSQWLILMAAVIVGTWALKKMKLPEKTQKPAGILIVVLAIVFFFIPFDEILTFKTSETAFKGTVLGDELMEDSGEMTHGVFFRDKRGTYSTVFFYYENGRYHKCAAENRETLITGEENGIYADIYHIAGTEDEYLLVRGFSPLSPVIYGEEALPVETMQTSSGILYYSMACIDYENATPLTVNGEIFPLA